jgi:hypothetical protein
MDEIGPKSDCSYYDKIEINKTSFVKPKEQVEKKEKKESIHESWMTDFGGDREESSCFIKIILFLIYFFILLRY